jgi:hypothetical protein
MKMNINKFDQYFSIFMPEAYDGMESGPDDLPENIATAHPNNIPCPYLQALKKKSSEQVDTTSEPGAL